MKDKSPMQDYLTLDAANETGFDSRQEAHRHFTNSLVYTFCRDVQEALRAYT